MTDPNNFLDIGVTPYHQALSSRLVLAIADNDSTRAAAVLAEIAAGGTDTLTAVLVVAARELAAVATAWSGPDDARAMFEAAILKAGLADIEKPDSEE